MRIVDNSFCKFYFTTIALTLIGMLEFIQNGSYLFFLLCFCLIAGLATLFMNKTLGKVMLTIGFGIITSWIFYYFIYDYQSKMAYKKIKSIPKEQLIHFIKTKDYNYIPEEKRYSWIGLTPQRIKIINKNKIRDIDAVGWEGNSVFGYYDCKEDKYVTSIK